MKNWCYTIPEGEHKGKTLWSGRYCAVSAFVFCEFPDGWKILANKRGSGTPDYQGKWNAPCGYLEADESAKQGCAREVYEETGVKINPDKFQLIHVETEPELCNNGNVTLRHMVILNYGSDNTSVSKEVVLNGNGEENEVESISWISVEDIDKYEWAFNHLNTIKDICNTYILSTSKFPVSTFNKVVETLVCKPSKENDEVQNQLEKELGITCNMIAHDFITWRKRELSKVNKL